MVTIIIGAFGLVDLAFWCVLRGGIISLTLWKIWPKCPEILRSPIWGFLLSLSLLVSTTFQEFLRNTVLHRVKWLQLRNWRAAVRLLTAVVGIAVLVTILGQFAGEPTTPSLNGPGERIALQKRNGSWNLAEYRFTFALMWISGFLFLVNKNMPKMPRGLPETEVSESSDEYFVFPPKGKSIALLHDHLQTGVNSLLIYAPTRLAPPSSRSLAPYRPNELSGQVRQGCAVIFSDQVRKPAGASLHPISLDKALGSIPLRRLRVASFDIDGTMTMTVRHDFSNVDFSSLDVELLTNPTAKIQSYMHHGERLLQQVRSEVLNSEPFQKAVLTLIDALSLVGQIDSASDVATGALPRNHHGIDAIAAQAVVAFDLYQEQLHELVYAEEKTKMICGNLVEIRVALNSFIVAEDKWRPIQTNLARIQDAFKIDQQILELDKTREETELLSGENIRQNAIAAAKVIGEIASAFQGQPFPIPKKVADKLAEAVDQVSPLLSGEPVLKKETDSTQKKSEAVPTGAAETHKKPSSLFDRVNRGPL